MNAKEQIEKIRNEAEEKIEFLKEARTKELDEAILIAKKAVKTAETSLKSLKDERAELIGRKSKTSAASPKTPAPKLTTQELEALSAKIVPIVKAAGSKGVGIGELHQQTSAHNDNIRAAIKQNKTISTQGEGRGTKYLVK